MDIYFLPWHSRSVVEISNFVGTFVGIGVVGNKVGSAVDELWTNVGTLVGIAMVGMNVGSVVDELWTDVGTLVGIALVGMNVGSVVVDVVSTDVGVAVVGDSVESKMERVGIEVGISVETGVLVTALVGASDGIEVEVEGTGASVWSTESSTTSYPARPLLRVFNNG